MRKQSETTDFVFLSVSQQTVCKMPEKKVIKNLSHPGSFAFFQENTVISLNISGIQLLFLFRNVAREVIGVARNLNTKSKQVLAYTKISPIVFWSVK